MSSHDAKWMQTLTGARIRIKTAGSETKNRLTIIDFIAPAHSAPPVFTRHEFIEVFCVVSGTLCFQFLDEPCIELNAGDNITCPSYKPHSFWNETAKPVEVHLVCSPAGLDEFSKASDALLKDTALDEQAIDAERLALCTRYGLKHVGGPPKSRRT